MSKTYEIKLVEDAWKLIILENDKALSVTVARNTKEGYEFLLSQAESICGMPNATLDGSLGVFPENPENYANQGLKP